MSGINASSILVYIIRYISEGYEDDYIEELLGISNKGMIVNDIKVLRGCNYKQLVLKKEEPLDMGNILNMYLNGFTFEELGVLTKYSKEGIRNKIISEIKKDGRSLKECKKLNSDMRKSIKDSIFYEEYLKDLDDDNLDEVIRRSPYSESTFLKKMKDLR